MRDRTHYSTNQLSPDRGEDWRDRALCADHDAELWFALDASTIDEAKTICRRCPAIDPCRDFALTTGQEYGVWAGLEHHERRDLRRTRPTPPEPFPADRVARLSRMVAAGIPLQRIADHYAVSLRTVHRWCDALDIHPRERSNA